MSLAELRPANDAPARQFQSLWRGLVDARVLAGGGDIRPARITARDIKEATASYFGLTEAVLVGRRRFQKIARSRMISMWLCRRLTKLSLPHIGRLHGNRDHTTSLHAVKRIDALRLTDPDIYTATESLLVELGGRELARGGDR